MKPRGQVLIIVAFLIPIGLLLVAIAIDAGRIFIERGKMQRAAGAAANAGISVVSDRMVTQAVARQTQASLAALATDIPMRTPTPSLSDPVAWLTDEDRVELVSSAMQSEASNEVMLFLEKNGYSPTEIDSLEVEIEYPQPGYDPYAPQISVLSMRVQVGRRLAVLLAGLLNEDWVSLKAGAWSQIPQR